MKILKRERKFRRKKRMRSKVLGDQKRPRLTVFKSNKHIYAQLINDEKGITLVSADDSEIKAVDKKVRQGKKSSGKAVKKRGVSKDTLNTSVFPSNESRVEAAFKVGELVARKSLKKKIERVNFDRSGYKYHGRVKALAEGARKGGLQF